MNKMENSHPMGIKLPVPTLSWGCARAGWGRLEIQDLGELWDPQGTENPGKRSTRMGNPGMRSTRIGNLGLRGSRVGNPGMMGKSRDEGASGMANLGTRGYQEWQKQG